MKLIHLAIVWLTLIQPAIGQPASTPPQLLRLAIIDTSSSMGSIEQTKQTRIDVVRDELLKLAQQLPPDQQHPFAIITFSSHAENARLFTDLKAFQAEVAALTPNGGTNIASGLSQGHRELTQHLHAQQDVVFLYTDGEDSDQEAILKEEAKLDALFAQRQRIGLHQTVVFCKRWGNTNLKLMQAFQEHKRAAVIDAGQLDLTPLTFEPRATAHQIRWLPDSDVAEIAIALDVAVRGPKSPSQLAALGVCCINSGLSAKETFSVVPGGAAVQRQLRLTVSPQERAARQLTLEFQIDPPQTDSSSGQLVLPVLATRHLQVPVALSPRAVRYKIMAGLKLSGPSIWDDPLKLVARFPVTLTLDVAAVTKTPGDPSAQFRVVPAGDAQLVSGDAVFKIPGPGKYDIPLKFTMPAADHSARLDSLRFALRLTLMPVSPPPEIIYEPPQLPMVLDNLSAPAPLQTTIKAAPDSVSAPQWTDLPGSLAQFEANLLFDVRGPLPPDTAAVLVASTPVQRFTFSPDKLRAGTQRVRLSIIARLPAAPSTTPITFAIVPPKPYAGVIFAQPKPVTFDVPGPDALRLVLLDGQRLPKILSTAVADNATHVQFTLQPIVYGLSDPHAAGTMSARFVPNQSRSPTARIQPLTLFNPHTVAMELEKPTPLPFFRDTPVVTTYSLLPDSPAPVLGTQYQVHVTILAPFKRLAFYFAVSLSILVTSFVLVRLYLRLRQTE